MNLLRFIIGGLMAMLLVDDMIARKHIAILETRVTQLETALKAQALINLARVQLRENP